MKKAKIMLSAIGLFSLIGGMLAFKAQHRNGQWKCGTTSTYCPYETYDTTNFGPMTSYCTFLEAPSTRCILTRATLGE